MPKLQEGSVTSSMATLPRGNINSNKPEMRRFLMMDDVYSNTVERNIVLQERIDHKKKAIEKTLYLPPLDYSHFDEV